MSVLIDPMQNEILRDWYFEALGKGMEKGRKEGLKKGLKEGLKEGRTEAYRGILQEQLKARFAPLPGWATERLSNAAADELRQWAIKLLSADSLESVIGKQVDRVKRSRVRVR